MKFLDDHISQAIRAQQESDARESREQLAASQYRTDLDAESKAAMALQLEASNSSEWYKFLRWQADNLTEGQIKNSTASYQMVLQYFGDEPLSLDALIECHACIPGVQRETRDKAKEALLKRYIELIPGSESMKKSLLSRMRYKTNSEIQESVELLEQNKRMRQLPTEEVRKLAKPQKPAADELPSHYTSQSLMDLDGKSLRAVILRYGSLAVTQRINQR